MKQDLINCLLLLVSVVKFSDETIPFLYNFTNLGETWVLCVRDPSWRGAERQTDASRRHPLQENRMFKIILKNNPHLLLNWIETCTFQVRIVQSVREFVLKQVQVKVTLIFLIICMRILLHKYILQHFFAITTAKG